MQTDPLPLRHGRAVLRRLDEQDLAAFRAYRTDPEVARYQDWAPMDMDTARAFLREARAAPAFPAGWWQVAIAREDGRLAGDLGLCLANDGSEVELGITLARSAQGMGLGVDAVRGAAELVWRGTRARRIRVITDARNAPALRLIARLGLARTGTLTDRGYPEPTFELPRPAGPTEGTAAPAAC